ncbi:MAG: alpha/beta fold hydrolase, partial [Anaerolineae bacterium]|nr:alpha/beta fold hydrolase [Anaerolineae bacterium]
MENIEKQFVRVGDVQLHVVTAGPTDGEPILLLHGFPEFWYGWHNQIPFLAEQGYRVIAPDQRGYNLSDKPEGVDAYGLDQLAADVIGLIDALGYEQVNLVGHDWGAAVSWWVANLYPERLKKLIILNVPYPTVMIEAFRGGNIAQLFKSWYMGFFQIPGLPEAVLSFNDFQGLVQGMNSIGHPNSFSQEDLDQYRTA